MFQIEDMMAKTHKFPVHVNLNQTSIQDEVTGFQVIMMQSSQEKIEKELPYKLSQLPDLFTFTKSPKIKTEKGSVEILLEGTKKCFRNDTNNTIDPKLTDLPNSIFVSVLTIIGHLVSLSDETKWPPHDSQICIISQMNEVEKCWRIVDLVAFLTVWKLHCHNLHLLTDIIKHLNHTLGVIFTILFPLIFGLVPENTFDEKHNR